MLIHDEQRVPCCQTGARNNPEGLISVSGRVSRVPRQSERRSVQIVFNRSTDGGALRRGVRNTQVRYYLASPWATTVAYRATPFVPVRSASFANPLYIPLGQTEFKKKSFHVVYDDIKELSVNNSVRHNWHLQFFYSGAARLLIADTSIAPSILLFRGWCICKLSRSLDPDQK